VILAAAVFEILCGKQTNIAENPTPATTIGVGNDITETINRKGGRKHVYF